MAFLHSFSPSLPTLFRPWPLLPVGERKFEQLTNPPAAVRFADITEMARPNISAFPRMVKSSPILRTTRANSESGRPDQVCRRHGPRQGPPGRRQRRRPRRHDLGQQHQRQRHRAIQPWVRNSQITTGLLLPGARIPRHPNSSSAAGPRACARIPSPTSCRTTSTGVFC